MEVQEDDMEVQEEAVPRYCVTFGIKFFRVIVGNLRLIFQLRTYFQVFLINMSLLSRHSYMKILIN